MKLRRSGAVSSTASSASRKPTIALIAAKIVVDWLIGPAVWSSRRSSLSAGRTSARPAARRCSSPATSRSAPGRGLTSTLVTRPGCSASFCATGSSATAILLFTTAPIAAPSSTARTVMGWASPLASTVTGCRGSAPIASARPEGSPMPSPISSAPVLRFFVKAPPSRTRLGVTPTSSYRATSPWPDDDGVLPQQRGRDRYTRQPPDSFGRPSVEPMRGARDELKARGADRSSHELPRRPREACAGYQHPEHERNTDRDPASRQGLLHLVAAQAVAVDEEQRGEPDTEKRWVEQAAGSHQEVTASSMSNPSFNCPSRSV